MPDTFAVPPRLLADAVDLREAVRKGQLDDVLAATSILAGTGLTGGGTLAATRTLTVDLGTGATQAATGDHTHAYVPTGQRGPIGGVQTITYAATITPDATLGVHFRVTMTGALTINVPTGGIDGQRILFELTASGAQRVVTLHASYELGEKVISRTVTVPSGLTGYVGVVNRSGTYRLLAVDEGA